MTEKTIPGVVTWLKDWFLSKSDVKDNLTSTNPDLPLSAKQGKWLKDNKIETAGTGLSKSGTSLMISNNGVGTAHIKDANVTNMKLADLPNLVTEYIVGTHGTTATSTWTGKSSKISSLQAGQVIYYKMTSAGTSTAVTLNLTLSDGTTTTGAKNVRYNMITNLTTHFPVNTILCLVYDGTYWVCTAIQNTNYYDRTANASQVICGEAITVNSLINGRNDGKYYKIASGGTLDIRYPIFWLATATNSGATATNLYSIYGYVNIQQTVSGKTLTASRQAYLEGDLNKNTLTISSNVFVTDDNLTNGKYYIPIGYMTNTTYLRFNNTNNTVYLKTSDGLIPVTDWSGITNKPSSFTPASHSHGSLANGGTLNSDISSVNKIAVTDSSNNLRTINKLPANKVTHQDISGKAPTNHKSSATTYGVGDANNYGHVKVDTTLINTSTNPVQNKVITQALAKKVDKTSIQDFAFNIIVYDVESICSFYGDYPGNPDSFMQLFGLSLEDGVRDMLMYNEEDSGIVLFSVSSDGYFRMGIWDATHYKLYCSDENTIFS